MNKLLNIVSLLLALLMCTLIFVSCRNTVDGDNLGDGTVNGDQPPEETENDTPRLSLVDGSSCKYVLVYPKSANKDVVALKEQIADEIKAKSKAVVTTKKDSEVAASSDTLEILLGTTNRTESAVPTIEANSVWYSVAVSGNKIIINASTDFMLEFAVSVFVEECITNTEKGDISIPVDYNITKEFKNFFSSTWTLDSEIPYFETSGTFASNIYNCGSNFLTFFGDTEDSMMLCINNSSQKEVIAYVNKLISCDYRVVSEMKPEFAYFTRLTNGIKSVIVAYETNTRVARVIVEEGVTTPEDISYVVEAAENQGAVFYQFGLLYDTDDSTSGAQPHGMCDIIKLSDNSIIIIDGGIQSQMKGNSGNYAPAAELDAFLHEITGTPNNKKITIACWYLTHPHDDHYGGFLEFVQKYPHKYNLNTVMVNLPDDADRVLNGGDTGWQNTVKKWAPVLQMYYPKTVLYKPHTGDKIQFADVTIEVLFTHEDLVDPITGKTTVTSDLNDVSTVTKIYTKGMSMIVLGDASKRVEGKMPKYYSNYIKADIVQLAHHAANELTDTYANIKAKYVFVPTCESRLTAGSASEDAKYARVMASVRKYAIKEYFGGSHKKTIGLAYRNGQITEVYPQKG
jgi:glyoxylase-like metal-dependent hydrolase (beta-lactamase superfamily II)